MFQPLVLSISMLVQSVLSPLFADLAKRSGGRVGVLATVIGSSDRAELNGAERFPIAWDRRATPQTAADRR
jgi:hypothetical protein